MRGDIQFAKIENKSKFKQALVVCLSFLLLISASIAWVTYSYFTATATVSGEIKFGAIAVSFVDGSGNLLSNSNFQSKFTQKILPGDTIDLSNVIVKNTGTHSAYVLINVNIDIVNDGAETMSYNVWYNVKGEEVHISDFALNSTKPTLLNKDATVTTYIKWKVPGEAITNAYKSATANVEISAYGVQTNLEEAVAYVDADLYASYYICKNATDEVCGEPLMKLGEIEDVLDYTTGTVTRKVGKVEFTGNEEGWWEYPNPLDSQGRSFVLNITGKAFGYKTSICSHFENIQASWASNYSASQGIYSDHPNYGYIYFRAPVGHPEIDTLAEWLTWVREQNAKGTPVTLWYQLASTELENVYASKNLWNSNTSISSNGTNGTATSTLLSTSSISIPKAENVQYTISFNLNAKDVTYSQTGNLIYFTLEYTDGTTNYVGVTTSNYQNRFVWFTTTAGKTLKSVKNVIANTCFVSGTIQLYNIQLEMGKSPTDFEYYDKTVYQRVNGVALRQVGDAKDTYDYSNKKITRNVAEYEFNGTEAWVLEYSGAGFIECFTQTFISTKKMGYTNIASNKFQLGTGYNSPINSIYGRDNNTAISLTISTSYATSAEGLSNLLKNWYNSKDPLVVYYQLATPTTENV